MVSVVKETKGNSHFYYLRHHSGATEKKRYLGKTIPQNIEQLKSDFILEFYHDEWNPKIQEIYKNHQKRSKIPESIKLKNFESFGITFTYNTQRIEGSSLTKSDTKDLLVFGITPAKKQQSDTIETQKHYELFMRLVTGKKLSQITQDIVFSWHKEIFGQTKIGEAGHIRQHRVGVVTNERITFASVPEIPKRLEEFFFWINKYDKKENPVEFVCLAHYKFVSIHPFADGNGRISRLIMNYILYKYDYPLLLIKNTDRKAYFKALERSQLEYDDIHFKKWFMKYYIKAK